MLTNREILILIGATIACLILAHFFIPQNDLSIINIVSLCSAYVTLTGFYITIKQLKSVRQIAREIDLTVKTKLSTFNKMLLLSDISSKISLINEIKSHLRREQFEICIIRMEDLKKVISSIGSLAYTLQLGIDQISLDSITQNFSVDMLSIEKKIINNSYNIRIDKIIANMDELSTYLIKLEVELKQY